MNQFGDLFKLEQDYIQTGDGWFGDDDDFGNKTKSYYTIDQEIPVCVKREGDYYINILCDDTCINDDDEKKNNSKLTKINKLTLITNKNMEYLKSFINDCVIYHDKHVNDTQTRYIYTYLGEDDNNKLTYDKEVFHPYASLDGLIGDNIKTIKKQMDFFHSDEGMLWYSTNRNLPYQLTHLYHGEPGTGKSIIISAIAKEYNLHIIKIKLSSIKEDREFIRVFKNKEFCGQNIEYRDMLFLFDEVDVEFDKLLKLHMLNEKILMDKDDDNDNKKPKSSNMTKQLSNFNTNELSLGTILEEINGINQMYGRKMILITNNFDKLKEIHNGALVRPGR